jgi:hypothetical protein
MPWRGFRAWVRLAWQDHEGMNPQEWDENDLPDQEILAMWDEGEPVNVTTGRWRPQGWDLLGQSEPSTGRATVVHRHHAPVIDASLYLGKSAGRPERDPQADEKRNLRAAATSR